MFDDLGARYVIQVPTGTTNITQAIVWANTSAEIVGHRIEAVEIGNEPNDYGTQALFQPPAYIGTVTNQR
jgi:hypothetical protein